MPDSDLPAADLRRIPLASERDAIVWYWPARAAPLGAVVFSHGNASSPARYAALIAPWLAAGYDVWAPLHVDSTEHPDTAAYPGLATWRARIEDMRAVSAQIAAPYVVAGHSYGALTALAMGGAEGERPEGIAGPMRDPAVRCVLAFSPPPPIPGLIAPEGYAALAVPALIQTGTADLMPGWPEPDWRVHLPAYACAAAGGARYLLVLDGVDHDFGGAICEPSVAKTPQQAELAEAMRVSNLFLAGYGIAADAGARARLDACLSPDLPARLVRK